MGWKTLSCKWHTFWMAPWLICYFTVISLHIEKKWLLKRNLATVFPWSPNCLENFSDLMLLMKISKYLKIVEFLTIPIKIKSFKTFCESQTAICSREVIQYPSLPHQVKASYVSRTNIFERRFTGMYRHLISRMQFLCV